MIYFYLLTHWQKDNPWLIEIPEVDSDDEGTYSALVTNGHVRSSFSDELEIKVIGMLFFLGSDQYLNMGEH